uniref:NADH-ubiquinone oxidoreductase chain 2 n=1 Tax=Wickerhamomyces canadensis TaxID=1156965 RepID=NU2M_WICCA|nr:NADH dehydrogenase subunit 2 [Wickerhamomyces canadensis]P48906.2 RecName: Full=NADH-ubiquinone oxidoreductase chain 2; AltName: Full=NADH dehydrogenase subunit 2 [Wickerhamomyces canadensis]BAA06573.2 NADH dehydrogenase subunit 2 [Wickerhamomyces canadensis]
MLILSLFILIIYSSIINNIDTINLLSSSNKIGWKLQNYNIIRIGIIIILYSLYIFKDISLSYIFNNYNNNNDLNIYIFNDLYKLNIFNIYIIFLLLIVIISLLSINTTYLTKIQIKNNNNNISIGKSDNYIELNIYYISIIIFNIIGLILLLTSNNLISIFISIELQSYSLYILTGIIPKSQKSGHNSLFYYLIGGIGSIIILYGISLLYYITSNIFINNINLIYSLDIYNINNNILIGWLFIIIGLLIKIGAAPMYNWSILLYSNSNTIITSYISLIPKISILSYILLIILNLYNLNNLNNLFNNNNNNNLIYILSIIIILSLIIGSIGGLTQIKIKNILAYSGLLNIGYFLLIILSLINNNNINSILAYIIYITQYCFNHISIFILLIIAIIYNNNYNNFITNKNLIYIYELNYIKNNRYLIFCLIIIIGSFIGIPPLFGFYGKYYLLISSINSNYLFLSLLLIISSIISSIYYLYFLNITLFDNNNNKNNNNNNNNESLLIPSFNIINDIKNNTSLSLSNKLKNNQVGNYITYILSSYILIILFNFIQWKNILKGTYLISILLF